jgi:hypothetical protein
MKEISKLLCVVAMVAGCAVEDVDRSSTARTEQALTDGGSGSGSGGGSGGGGSVWHANWNGGSASVTFWDAYSGGYLNAWESKSGGTRTAYLWFDRYSVDPASLQCVTYNWWGWDYTYCYYTRYSYDYGWGEVAGTDVVINNGVARVHSTLPSTFYSLSCTIDYNDWTNTTCSTGTGSTVDVVWHKDGLTSTFSSGTSQQDWGSYSFKSQGTYSSSSALANGSLLGHDFADARGSFGDSHSTSIGMDIVNHAP